MVGQHQNSGGQPEPVGVGGQKRQQVKGIGDWAVGRQFHAARRVVRIDAVVASRQDGVLDGNDRFEAACFKVARECRHPPRVCGDTGSDGGDNGEFHGLHGKLKLTGGFGRADGRLGSHGFGQSDRPVIGEHVLEQHRAAVGTAQRNPPVGVFVGGARLVLRAPIADRVGQR